MHCNALRSSIGTPLRAVLVFRRLCYRLGHEGQHTQPAHALRLQPVAYPRDYRRGYRGLLPDILPLPEADVPARDDSVSRALRPRILAVRHLYVLPWRHLASADEHAGPLYVRHAGRAPDRQQ